MNIPIPYINEAVWERDFKFYIFDWDDNILHMPTKIVMEPLGVDGVWKEVELSTSIFALVRGDTEHYRPPSNGGWQRAFANFSDDGEQGDNNRFLADTLFALSKVCAGEKPTPSYNTFKKTLIEGRLFAIVTARGHEPETIRNAVRLFIDYGLSPLEKMTMLSNLRGYRKWLDKVEQFGTDEEEISYYLNMCRYSPVTNDGFWQIMANDPIYKEKLAFATSVSKPELAKEFAIRDFVEHVYHTLKRTGALHKPIAIGFSDDDKGNVRSAVKYIQNELSKRFEGIKFVVYDTSDKSLPKGRKVCVSGQMNLPGFDII